MVLPTASLRSNTCLLANRALVHVLHMRRNIARGQIEVTRMKKTKKRRADHGVTRQQYKRRKEVSDLLRHFSKYLTVRRQQLDLPLRTIAERAGMAHSSVHQMEHSTHDPHLSELLKLAQAFNEPLQQFLAPFLQDHEEELEAPAESGERKETFAEIPFTAEDEGLPPQSRLDAEDSEPPSPEE